MKAAKQSLITPGVEFEGAHQAGDAEQLAAHGESGGDGGKPQKGQIAAEGGSQQAKGLVPVEPKRHGKAWGELRPGSLTQQFKDRESQTGPYYQLSYTLDMKSRTDYVSNDALADVRRQVANYKRFKELCAQWVALGIEHSKLKMKLKPKS